jgi:hypothetical protein
MQCVIARPDPLVLSTLVLLPDGSRAIQSMMLAAWSEGVGSNWVGFMGMTEVKVLLCIPDELDVLAIIPFGYPAKPLGKGGKIANRFQRSPTSSGSVSRFSDPISIGKGETARKKNGGSHFSRGLRVVG